MHPDDYLDHAATSWPKPEPVLTSLQRWFSEIGVSADRGDSDASALVRQEVHAIRQALGDQLGTTAERVAFTSGATASSRSNTTTSAASVFAFSSARAFEPGI